ncbi:MAG: peptidoglycan DD-metalloendopeptidase family protein [Candidatus Spechtbacterales bacterium]
MRYYNPIQNNPQDPSSSSHFWDAKRDDIQRYKRMIIAKVFKRGGSSIFLYYLRGVAIFIFVAGLISMFNTKELNGLVSLHTSAQEEVVIDKDAQKANFAGVQPFISAKLLNSANAVSSKDEDSVAIGGAFDTTFPTNQGSSLLSNNSPVIADTPPQQRNEITEYTVKPGDTANGIARSFGLKLETLLWSNHFRDSNYIQPGEVLSILPTDGVLYEIKSGDTLSVIARNHKAEIADILETNGIENETHIFAGQTIIIPGGTKPAPARTAPSARAPRYASSLQNIDGYFAHPTNGVGRISQWLHGTNAVDIAAPRWTPIYAAASGTVGISIGNGRWNGGFGNYVTINHYNGTRTLYAHMIQTAVASGQSVTKGQVIGYMGSTGRSTGSHLHWEVHGARNYLAY